MTKEQRAAIQPAIDTVAEVARLMHQFALRRLKIDGIEYEIDITRSDEINEGRVKK